jgi:hypothetical protein
MPTPMLLANSLGSLGLASRTSPKRQGAGDNVTLRGPANAHALGAD